MPPPIQLGAAGLDLSPRVFKSTSVAASPSAATITTVCTVTINEDIAVMEGVWVVAQGAFTVGANGVSVLLQIRRTDTSGTVVGSTGAVTYTAADLGSLSVQAFDTGASVPGQVYVLAATVASASAESTFSQAKLVCLVV